MELTTNTPGEGAATQEPQGDPALSVDPFFMVEPNDDSTQAPEGQPAVEPGGQPAATQTSSQDQQADSQKPPYAAKDLPEHISPEQAYGGWTYWQSQHDKVQQQLQQQQQQMEQYQHMGPVVQAIMEHPAILNELMQKTSGQPVFNPVAGNGAAQASQVIPEPPQKPENYSLYEAANEPESASARYFAAMQDYQQQQMQAMIQQQQSFMQQQQQQQASQSFQQKQQVARAQLQQRLMYEMGANAQQAQQFMQWAQNVEYNESTPSFPLETVYQYWLSTQRPSAQQLRQQQVSQAAGQRQSAVTAVSQSSQGMPAPQDSFFVGETETDPVWQ